MVRFVPRFDEGNPFVRENRYKVEKPPKNTNSRAPPILTKPPERTNTNDKGRSPTKKPPRVPILIKHDPEGEKKMEEITQIEIDAFKNAGNVELAYLSKDGQKKSLTLPIVILIGVGSVVSMFTIFEILRRKRQ